jgi:hypothetical protein
VLERGDRQTRFYFLEPHLEKKIAEDRKSVAGYAIEGFRKFEGSTRVRTNISKIETWLPYFYWKDGLVDEPEMRSFGERAEVASVQGQEIHYADTLFNLIVQGTVGAMVKDGLPSAGREDLDAFYYATDDIEIGGSISKGELLEIMTKSWEKFLSMRFIQESERAETVPMFGDMGFSNPLLRLEILESEGLFKKGSLLAEHWTRRYFGVDKEKWGHGINHQSVNEVLTIVNTELLQLVGRLDRVVRQDKAKKTVTVQVTDLKTGNREPQGELEKEIKKRQAQLALFMAEQFTTRYILDKRWLGHKGKGFPLNTSVLNKAAMGRARFFYRWLDRDKVFWEEVTMDEEERSEFVEWLIWYSTKAQEYRDELKKLR